MTHKTNNKRSQDQNNQNSKWNRKCHELQELNGRRKTLQQSFVCAACHLILRLLTDAHHYFDDGAMEWLCHQSARLQECCMKPMWVSLFDIAFNTGTCSSQLHISCSHAHKCSLALCSSGPHRFLSKREAGYSLDMDIFYLDNVQCTVNSHFKMVNGQWTLVGCWMWPQIMI